VRQKSSVALITVPYDSALRNRRMGAGPDALLQLGLVERLTAAGTECDLIEIGLTGPFHAEVAAAFELHARIRDEVAAARSKGRLAICLTGNCNTGVIGSLAAHRSADVGLIWFDAHSDAETPETSTSGFLDGMAMAIALGRCWRPKLEELGWVGIDGRKVALVGAREVSAAASRLLSAQGVNLLPPALAQSSSEALKPVCERFRAAGVRRLHVHVDLDVLDSELVGPANSYALPGGLTVPQLLDHIRVILEAFPVASASVASYDPEVDASGAVAAAGLRVIEMLAASGTTQ